MVTSGGYLRETARIVANSILNLRHKSLISCTEAEQAGLIEPDGEPVIKPVVSSRSTLCCKRH